MLKATEVDGEKSDLAKLVLSGIDRWPPITTGHSAHLMDTSEVRWSKRAHSISTPRADLGGKWSPITGPSGSSDVGGWAVKVRY